MPDNVILAVGVALQVAFTAPGVLVGANAWLPELRAGLVVRNALIGATLGVLLVPLFALVPLLSVLVVLDPLYMIVGLVAGIAYTARSVRQGGVWGAAVLGFITQYIGLIIYAYLEPWLGGPVV